MPLVNTEELNKIFNAYEATLDRQPSTKKKVAETVNYLRMAFGNWLHPEAAGQNDYLDKGLEKTKRTKIVQFRQQYAEIESKQLNEEKECEYWIKHLQILYAELMQVKYVEQMNESKYGYTLRVIASLVQSQIGKHPLYIAEITKYKQQYRRIQQELDIAANNGNHAQPDEERERNQTLINLVKLGNIDGTVKASQLGLLKEFAKPDSSEFSSTEINNSALSRQVEIHPDVPWAFQVDFLDLYLYRLKKQCFPRTKEEWNFWKSDARNLHSFTKIHESLLNDLTDLTTPATPSSPQTTPTTSTAQVVAMLPNVSVASASSTAINDMNTAKPSSTSAVATLAATTAKQFSPVATATSFPISPLESVASATSAKDESPKADVKALQIEIPKTRSQSIVKFISPEAKADQESPKEKVTVRGNKR